ncbi:MAG: MarR family transcriptional regulator [Kineosporiaceae bacterium]
MTHDPRSGAADTGRTVPATANLLGALALVVTDQSTDRLDAACGQTGAAAAALSALQHILTRPSLDELGAVLALTPSGTVRLVDRLGAAGLVTRGPGRDGRTRAVTLTAAGRRAAARVTAARAGYLEGLLARLTDDDRRLLHTLLGKVLASVVEGKDSGPWICRLCDLRSCGRSVGACPTADAAAAKYAL